MKFTNRKVAQFIQSISLASLCMLFCNQQLKAQAIELGYQIGGSNYWGDLAPKIVLSETNLSSGLFARLNLSNSFAWKNELNFHNVSGTDQNFEINKSRNLNFHSKITEFASVIEFNFDKYGTGVLDKKITSYFFGGLSYFRFNPQTEINGNTVDLATYQTEDVAYSKSAMAIPFGMGVKWMVNKNFALEWQIGFRKTFTDYIDDVSTVYPDIDAKLASGLVAGTLADRSIESNHGTPLNKQGFRRGNPDYNDWFMSSTFSICYRINSRVKCARVF